MSKRSFSRLVRALVAVTALTLAACSGSSPATGDAVLGEVRTQAAGDAASEAVDAGSGAADGDVASAPVGLPNWYVCDTNTFLASSVPVSVVAANTTQDEDLGGIFAAETFTFGVDGDNSRCEIFYGSDPAVQQSGTLGVLGIVGDPSSVSRLFENSISVPAQPQAIGTVEALVAEKDFGVAIYFEVEGAGVLMTVDSFLSEHAANEVGGIGVELAELVVATATSS